jgi:predicted MFS family arabinose efflux permease
MALVADSTRESNRTKAMALIGISIGMAFMIALVAGPILYKSISVPGMFWMTAVLAVAGIVVILFVVPTPEQSTIHRDAEVVSGQVGRVLHNIELLRLDFGIFVLHLIMTALFLAYPLLLRDMGGIASEDHWTVYLPVLVLSIMLMVPFIIFAERKGKTKQVFLFAITALAIGLFGIGELASGKWGLVGWLLLFFAAFNLLEASLPSLISKIAPADAKGTAMGVYSTSQFAGAFLGGAAGGLVHQQFGAQAVLLFGAGMAVLWLLFAASMKSPEPLRPRLVNIRNMTGSSGEISNMLHKIAGVREVVVVPDEGVAYLKVDSKKLDNEALEAMEASA